MKIVIATGPFFPIPALQGGSVHRMWKNLAEEFARYGHDVVILCRPYPGQPKNEIINKVRYFRKVGFNQASNIWKDLITDFWYAVLTCFYLPQADILIINDFWLPLLAGFKPKVGKIVVNANRFPKGQYFLYFKTQCFAAASNVVKSAIIQQCKSTKSRVKVFPNAIDTKIFHPLKGKVKGNRLVILYVGRVHPEKGLHLLIEAFGRLSSRLNFIELMVVGPSSIQQGGGGEGYIEALQTTSDTQHLKVKFLSPIFDPPRLANIYQQADIFCYPSLAENGEALPVAPLEAMACGLTPVVSSLDCFKDFIEHEKTGYFFNHRDENASEKLSEILYFAIMNWDKTVKISKAAQEEAFKYDTQQIAKLYLSEFRKLIDQE